MLKNEWSAFGKESLKNSNYFSSSFSERTFTRKKNGKRREREEIVITELSKKSLSKRRKMCLLNIKK